MIRLLLEGIESAPTVSSVMILIPAAAAALAARQESTAALVGFAVAFVGAAWLRFADRSDQLGALTTAGLLAVGAAFLVVPVVRRLDAVAALGGLLVGLATAALWEPIVGAEFGALLDGLPTRGAAGLALLAIHVLGVAAPIVLLGVALHVIPDPILLPIRPVMLAVGGGTLGVVALFTAVGRYDRLVGGIVEWVA